MTDEPLLPVDPTDFDQGAAFGPAFVLNESIPEEPEEKSEDEQALDDLDERAQQDFVGLLYLGHLEEECTVAGHRFLLRTPGQDERLEMGFVHKPYLNSMSTEMAWKNVFVAAYLQRIDSAPAPEPLSAGVGAVRTRFEWLNRSIASSVVIAMLYDECLLLAAREARVVEYLDRLGETSA